MSKTVDYLIEDMPITGQRYGLVSIIGPNMPQKCDVWGMKVRGSTDTLDQAKVLMKKLMSLDPDYDIYIVEVGKFFPLTVEPSQVGNVEYQNEQLNLLAKNYMENRDHANKEFQERKIEMVKEAMKEGSKEGQLELSNKPEHAVAVLHRMREYVQKSDTLKQQLEKLEENLKLSKEKFELYSEEERQSANQELEKNTVVVEEPVSSTNIEDVSAVFAEDTIEELEKTLAKLDITHPTYLKLESKLKDLKDLKNKETNDLINSKFNESSHSNLFE